MRRSKRDQKDAVGTTVASHDWRVDRLGVTCRRRSRFAGLRLAASVRRVTDQLLVDQEGVPMVTVRVGRSALRAARAAIMALRMSWDPGWPREAAVAVWDLVACGIASPLRVVTEGVRHHAA